MTERVSTSEEAATRLLDGVRELRVAAAMYPSQPDGLLRALVTVSARLGVELTLLVADLSGRFRFLDGPPPPNVRVVTIGGRVARRLSASVDHLPSSLYEIARRLGDGTRRIDAFVTRLAAPDDRGRCSYGPIISYSQAAISAARTAVAVVGPASPPMPGTPGPGMAELDLVVTGEQEPYPTLPSRRPSDEELLVGRHLADVIPDGATLQLGIGGIPEGLAAALAGKRRLGLHSGAVPEGAIDLIEAGVVTGEAKEIDPGVHVTTSLLGTQRLYDYAGEASNGIELRPVGYTHDPATLLRFKRLYGVNSCYEIDLLGQVGAEYAGGVRTSSMGGQTDFGRWAHLAEDGASIIALTSRTKGGCPRIVPALSPPGCVTTHRTDVDFVVTEHGVAALRGRSAAERRRALVAVAHPDDRAALEEAGSRTRQGDRT